MTAVTILAFSVSYVPRQYIDYSGLPLLSGVSQPETYGTDTIADIYGAKVVLNDVGDMYTKAHLAQTPIEAATWSKEESAPYPPVLRLTHAVLLAVGEWTGIGFYGLILSLAVLFLAGSAWYSLRTRWYLFPLLYLNFAWFAERFVSVQDGSYLVMLVCVLAALALVHRRATSAALLMALAATMKLLPLGYARYLPRMSRIAWIFAAILIAGLVLPFFIWADYGQIYRFANERKGNDWLDVAGALALTVPFTLALWYVEERCGYDAEERIGSSLVPFALLAALVANSGRHLLIALIVPDKRVGRNLAAAVAVGLHTLLPGIVRLGSVTYVATAVLCVVLACELQQIGWAAVEDDLRHPVRTLRLLITGRELDGENGFTGATK